MEKHINKKYLLIPLILLLIMIGRSIYLQQTIKNNGTLVTAKIIKATNCPKGSTCFEYEYFVSSKKYTGNGKVAHPLSCIDYPMGCYGKKCIVKYSDKDNSQSIFIKLKE